MFMVMGYGSMGLYGFSGYFSQPCRKGRSAININRCRYFDFMTAKKRFFWRNRIFFRENCYICPQILWRWKGKSTSLSVCLSRCCCLARVPLTHRGPWEKPNGRWNSRENERKNSTKKPSRRTTKGSRKRQNAWLIETDAGPTVCGATNAPIPIISLVDYY